MLTDFIVSFQISHAAARQSAYLLTSLIIDVVPVLISHDGKNNTTFS